MRRVRNRLLFLYQRCRIAQFRFLSNCENVQGNPRIQQPVQFVGKGTIRFNGNVTLGFFPSPYFLSGYIYMEARSPESIIQIEDGVYMNNSVCLVSDGPGIFIGKDSMLGTHCEIIDSDFHDLHPDRRKSGAGKTGKVEIGENVLIGSNVKIMKGVRIGANSVVANGAVVTRSFPENVLIFGNPAKGGLGLALE